jgi:class 3 adenylate cyclase
LVALLAYLVVIAPQVRMGFGLHAGWAIEGAVGSLQKVDATYLSPHVNMAARLETSSKQYGVPLLASQVRWCMHVCVL